MVIAQRLRRYYHRYPHAMAKSMTVAADTALRRGPGFRSSPTTGLMSISVADIISSLFIADGTNAPFSRCV